MDKHSVYNAKLKSSVSASHLADRKRHSRPSVTSVVSACTSSDDASVGSGSVKCRSVPGRSESTDSRFPKLADCEHFHYEVAEIPQIQVLLDLRAETDTCVFQEYLPKHPLKDSGVGYTFTVKTHDESWTIKRSYASIRDFDVQLHTCVYDRSQSGLQKIPKSDSLQIYSSQQICSMLIDYFERFSDIASSLITCAPVLTWLEMDNKGNHLVALNENAAINKPAIAAAHVVRSFAAETPNELTLNNVPPGSVFQPEASIQLLTFMNKGDIVSVIDMPSTSESIWWRGKKDFKVGFFPHHNVHLIDPPKKIFPAEQGQEKPVPLVLKSCCAVIESHGIIDGIYRLSGIQSNCHHLRQAFDENREPNLLEDRFLQDIHCIASLVKMYFRELPNPLFTYQLYHDFEMAIREKESNLRILMLHKVVQQLPPPHYRTAEYLTRHLVRVSEHAGKTGMNFHNLATVWAPNLFRCQDGDGASRESANTMIHRVTQQAQMTEYVLKYADIIFSHKLPTNLIINPSAKDTTAVLRGKTKRTPSRPVSIASTCARNGRELQQNGLESSRDVGLGKAVILDGKETNYREGALIDINGGPDALPTYRTSIEIPRDRNKLARKPGVLSSIFGSGNVHRGKAKVHTADKPHRGWYSRKKPDIGHPVSSRNPHDKVLWRHRPMRSARSAESLLSGYYNEGDQRPSSTMSHAQLEERVSSAMENASEIYSDYSESDWSSALADVAKCSYGNASSQRPPLTTHVPNALSQRSEHNSFGTNNSTFTGSSWAPHRMPGPGFYRGGYLETDLDTVLEGSEEKRHSSHLLSQSLDDNLMSPAAHGTSYFGKPGGPERHHYDVPPPQQSNPGRRAESRDVPQSDQTTSHSYWYETSFSSNTPPSQIRSHNIVPLSVEPGHTGVELESEAEPGHSDGTGTTGSLSPLSPVKVPRTSSPQESMGHGPARDAVAAAVTTAHVSMMSSPEGTLSRNAYSEPEFAPQYAPQPIASCLPIRIPPHSEKEFPVLNEERTNPTDFYLIPEEGNSAVYRVEPVAQEECETFALDSMKETTKLYAKDARVNFVRPPMVDNVNMSTKPLKISSGSSDTVQVENSINSECILSHDAVSSDKENVEQILPVSTLNTTSAVSANFSSTKTVLEKIVVDGTEASSCNLGENKAKAAGDLIHAETDQPLGSEIKSDSGASMRWIPGPGEPAVTFPLSEIPKTLPKGDDLTKEDNEPKTVFRPGAGVERGSKAGSLVLNLFIEEEGDHSGRNRKLVRKEQNELLRSSSHPVSNPEPEAEPHSVLLPNVVPMKKDGYSMSPHLREGSEAPVIEPSALLPGGDNAGTMTNTPQYSFTAANTMLDVLKEGSNSPPFTGLKKEDSPFEFLHKDKSPSQESTSLASSLPSLRKSLYDNMSSASSSPSSAQLDELVEETDLSNCTNPETEPLVPRTKALKIPEPKPRRSTSSSKKVDLIGCCGATTSSLCGTPEIGTEFLDNSHHQLEDIGKLPERGPEPQSPLPKPRLSLSFAHPGGSCMQRSWTAGAGATDLEAPTQGRKSELVNTGDIKAEHGDHVVPQRQGSLSKGSSGKRIASAIVTFEAKPPDRTGVRLGSNKEVPGEGGQQSGPLSSDGSVLHRFRNNSSLYSRKEDVFSTESLKGRPLTLPADYDVNPEEQESSGTKVKSNELQNSPLFRKQKLRASLGGKVKGHQNESFEEDYDNCRESSYESSPNNEEKESAAMKSRCENIASDVPCSSVQSSRDPEKPPALKLFYV